MTSDSPPRDACQAAAVQIQAQADYLYRLVARLRETGLADGDPLARDAAAAWRAAVELRHRLSLLAEGHAPGAGPLGPEMRG